MWRPWPVLVVLVALVVAACAPVSPPKVVASQPPPAPAGPTLVADCWMKGGCEQGGDWDADGKRDHARSVKNEQGHGGIELTLGSGQVMVLGSDQGGQWWLPAESSDGAPYAEDVPGDLHFLVRWEVRYTRVGDTLLLDGGDSVYALSIVDGKPTVTPLGY